MYAHLLWMPRQETNLATSSAPARLPETRRDLHASLDMSVVASNNEHEVTKDSKKARASLLVASPEHDS